MLPGPVQEEVEPPKLSVDLLEEVKERVLVEGRILAEELSFVEAEGSGEGCPLVAACHDAYGAYPLGRPDPPGQGVVDDDGLVHGDDRETVRKVVQEASGPFLKARLSFGEAFLRNLLSGTTGLNPHLWRIR